MKKTDKIVEQVVEKLQSRSEVGIVKYGTTLNDNNRDPYLLHLQYELLDGANYIEKLLTQKQDLIQIVMSHPNDEKLGKAIREFVK
jgi:hypothetical protein